jgi:hypothetical protein
LPQFAASFTQAVFAFRRHASNAVFRTARRIRGMVNRVVRLTRNIVGDTVFRFLPGLPGNTLSRCR